MMARHWVKVILKTFRCEVALVCVVSNEVDGAR